MLTSAKVELASEGADRYSDHQDSRFFLDRANFGWAVGGAVL